MNFGGTADKQFTRMPNEGNVCAYPGCTLGKTIAEGAPARYALADPTKWCHKECADRWERFGAEQAPQPVIDVDPILCGAPHPELHDFTCSKPQHPGDNYHHSGAGHSWYMEPGQVASLQAAIEQRNQTTGVTVEQQQPSAEELVANAPPLPRNAKPPWVTPKVEEVNFGEYTTPHGRNTAEPDIKISVGPLEEALQTAENTSEPEDPTGEVSDTHQCCEHCGSGGHAPHSQGCPAELAGWKLGENIADEADTRPPPESLFESVTNAGSPFLVEHNEGTRAVTGNLAADAVNFLGLQPNQAQRANQADYDHTAVVLELVAIFQHNGFNSAPAGLITDLIAWKQG